MLSYERVIKVEEKLEQSKWMFQLTGSYYFGVATSRSDIDYFVANEPGVIEFLKEIGFCHVSSSQYRDSNTVLVFRYSQGYEQIDVQVVKDFNLKVKVQEKFKELDITKPTQEQWNLAFLLLA